VDDLETEMNSVQTLSIDELEADLAGVDNRNHKNKKKDERCRNGYLCRLTCDCGNSRIRNTTYLLNPHNPWHMRFYEPVCLQTGKNSDDFSRANVMRVWLSKIGGSIRKVLVETLTNYSQTHDAAGNISPESFIIENDEDVITALEELPTETLETPAPTLGSIGSGTRPPTYISKVEEKIRQSDINNFVGNVTRELRTFYINFKDLCAKNSGNLDRVIPSMLKGKLHMKNFFYTLLRDWEEPVIKVVYNKLRVNLKAMIFKPILKVFKIVYRRDKYKCGCDKLLVYAQKQAEEPKFKARLRGFEVKFQRACIRKCRLPVRPPNAVKPPPKSK